MKIANDSESERCEIRRHSKPGPTKRFFLLNILAEMVPINMVANTLIKLAFESDSFNTDQTEL